VEIVFNMSTETVSIVIKNNKAWFDGKYPRDIVDDAISVLSDGYRFSPAFKAKRWDGKLRLLSRVNNSFPAGVIDIVVKELKENGYEVNLRNVDLENASLRLPEAIMAQWPSGFDLVPSVGPFVLRDYQIEAGKAFLSGKGNLPYCGILHVATGGGKTVISAAIAKSLCNVAPLNILFLVHGKSLVTQAHKVFSQCFDEVGIIQGSNVDIHPITIASVDSINSKLKASDEDILEYLQSVNLIISDECHRFSSKTYINILKMVNAPMRLGLSGTPIKKQSDRDLLLQSQTGPVMTRIKVDDLQAQGHVSDATLTLVVVPDPVMNTLPWRDAYNALIVEHTSRTATIAKLAIDRAQAGKTVLILAGNSVLFSEHIDNAIKAHNTAPFVLHKRVDGKSSLSDVDGCFDELRKRSISILTTTLLADEGIDIPDINVLMLVGGGKSYVKAIQRIGRGLRLKTDGSSLEVIDFFDTTNTYLSKHAKARLDYYKEENLFSSANMVTYDNAL
jgi:superfamily II DNA or RNA helicase